MIKSILTIEDDKFIGEMYVRSLRNEGFDVDWAVDGNDGLVMARNKKYDLILVDIMLPEKRGNTIIEENRKSDSLSKDAKVIFMTNFQHNSTEREKFLKSGDGYFVKSDTIPRKIAEMIRDLQ